MNALNISTINMSKSNTNILMINMHTSVISTSTFKCYAHEYNEVLASNYDPSTFFV